MVKTKKTCFFLIFEGMLAFALMFHDQDKNEHQIYDQREKVNLTEYLRAFRRRYEQLCWKCFCLKPSIKQSALYFNHPSSIGRLFCQSKYAVLQSSSRATRRTICTLIFSELRWHETIFSFEASYTHEYLKSRICISPDKMVRRHPKFQYVHSLGRSFYS